MKGSDQSGTAATKLHVYKIARMGAKGNVHSGK
jgi:hypothetical protein